MVPRYFEFYIPVLKVLSTIEEKKINNIVDESSELVGLSAEDKLLTTPKYKQLQYRNNISWAITDLCQAGFIDRVSRGTYVITIEGLEFLEENPQNPTRATLADKSEKFRNFINKARERHSKDKTSDPAYPKGNKQPIKNKTEMASYNHASSLPKNEIISDDEASVSLQELYHTLSILRKANLSTYEIEQRIKELETDAIFHKIAPKISKMLDAFYEKMDYSGSIIIEYRQQDSMTLSFNHLTSTIKLAKSHTTSIIHNDNTLSSITNNTQTKEVDTTTKEDVELPIKKHSNETALNTPSFNSTGVWIGPHTDLTFAVYGDTEPFIDLFKSYGGCLRQHPSYGECWIFMNNRRHGLEHDLKDFLIELKSDNSDSSKFVDNSLKMQLKAKESKVDDENKQLKKYRKQLCSLRSFDFLGITGPHKEILLLTIFELIHNGSLKSNKIYYSNELEDLYNKQWQTVEGTAPTLGAAYPFVHLGKEPFFLHETIRQIQDYNDVWNKLKIKQYISCSQIDSALFNLLKKKKYYDELSTLLLSECSIKSGNKTSVSYKMTTDTVNHKEGFYEYMLLKKKNNGDHYQHSSIDGYLRSLSSQFINDIVSSILPSDNIFDISDLTLLKRIERLISSANSEGLIPVTHKSAIRMYIQYIQGLIISN